MKRRLGVAPKTAGRRGSQTRPVEGGRYLDTSPNRPAAATAINSGCHPFRCLTYGVHFMSAGTCLVTSCP